MLHTERSIVLMLLREAYYLNAPHRAVYGRDAPHRARNFCLSKLNHHPKGGIGGQVLSCMHLEAEHYGILAFSASVVESHPINLDRLLLLLLLTPLLHFFSPFPADAPGITRWSWRNAQRY